MSRRLSNQTHNRQKKASKRPVEIYFDAFEKEYGHPVNRWIQVFGLPMFFFAVLGLVWVIPFPEIGLLKRYGYDTFVNWGSFFIAIIVYIYLRLAPMLSYAVLLSIGVFSFFIVQLEYAERAGGLPVWLVCVLLLQISLVALLVGRSIERRPVPLSRFLHLLMFGPIWLWHYVFKRLKLPY